MKGRNEYLLLSKNTYVTWNPRNKKHYVNLGYQFTKMGDEFLVDINDLTIGSSAIIELQCDYCGKIYHLQWQSYMSLKKREITHKDACKQCCELKANDSISEKYGDYSGLFNSTKEKREKTNIDRYGCTNVFSSDEIKRKIVEVNLEKYGVEYNQQCPEVRAKTMETCRKRYGVDNYIELFKGKFTGENSPSWKGGVSTLVNPRASMDLINWRKAVFGRDMHTCQVCGAHSEKGSGTITLNAHHIFNWKDYPELRYDIDNGITMCERCHLDFHMQYGKHMNNKDQLDEFINVHQKELDKEIC